MKRTLQALIAVNHSAKADVLVRARTACATPARLRRRRNIFSEHPAVRTHPETGRKALYINIGHTVRFKDMTETESAPLLNFLFEYQTKPEFTCRLQLARRLAGVLGQSLRPAQSGQRLSRLPPRDAPRDVGR